MRPFETENRGIIMKRILQGRYPKKFRVEAGKLVIEEDLNVYRKLSKQSYMKSSMGRKGD